MASNLACEGLLAAVRVLGLYIKGLSTGLREVVGPEKLISIKLPPKNRILGVFTRIHAASQIANFAIFSQIAEMSVHFFDLSKESGFGNLNLRRLPTTSDSRNVLVLAKQAHFIFTITIIMLTLPLSKLDGISVYRTD